MSYYKEVSEAMSHCKPKGNFSRSDRLRLVAFYLLGRFSDKLDKGDAEYIKELVSNDTSN